MCHGSVLSTVGQPFCFVKAVSFLEQLFNVREVSQLQPVPDRGSQEIWRSRSDPDPPKMDNAYFSQLLGMAAEKQKDKSTSSKAFVSTKV